MSDDVDPRVRHIKYKCSQCGKTFDREDLTVKRVEWSTIGEGYKTLQRRTVGWFCPACRQDDPEYDLPKRSGSPGMANTKLAEVRDG